MTRSELINSLAARFPELQRADIETAVRVMMSAMAGSLVEGKRIEIRGFGSFATNVRPPRVGRNPKTGVTVEVPAKRAINFKPGLELRDRVDFPRP